MQKTCTPKTMTLMKEKEDDASKWEEIPCPLQEELILLEWPYYQGILQIQSNLYQNVNGIFHRTRTSNFKICWIFAWQYKSKQIAIAILRIFLGSKITADGDCSHEIKRRLLLGRKVMTNLDSILKSRDITLLTKVCLVKAMFFSVVMYGCESWTIKKAECQRIDAFELWC